MPLCLFGVVEYELLSVMLTGRSLESHRQLFGLGSSAMTRKDWMAVRNTFMQFDKVMNVLRALPTSLILVLRNINIVRSLNRDLGCPVNRYNIMARRYKLTCVVFGCGMCTCIVHAVPSKAATPPLGTGH